MTTQESLVVGYGKLSAKPPYTHIGAAICVHPEYRGQGIGTYLNQWAEARARAFLSRVPSGQRVVLASGAVATDTTAHDLLVTQGYQRMRCFSALRIDMVEPPPEPSWPKGIVVRPKIAGQEERIIYNTMQETFREHWGHIEEDTEEGFRGFVKRHIETEPYYDPSLWFLVLANEQVVGFLFCYPSSLQYPDMGWIEVLGVHRDWRRRGIGLGLLHHAFGVLYGRGICSVGLAVDTENVTDAMRLYLKAGMHPFFQWYRYHKELRAGED